MGFEFFEKMEDKKKGRTLLVKMKKQSVGEEHGQNTAHKLRKFRTQNWQKAEQNNHPYQTP